MGRADHERAALMERCAPGSPECHSNHPGLSHDWYVERTLPASQHPFSPTWRSDRTKLAQAGRDIAESLKR